LRPRALAPALNSFRGFGFVEFWTIYSVRNLDLAKAHEKSPTTNRFYNLRELLAPKSETLDDFRDRLISLVGIAAPRLKKI
jgi:hypothetical protein